MWPGMRGLLGLNIRLHRQYALRKSEYKCATSLCDYYGILDIEVIVLPVCVCPKTPGQLHVLKDGLDHHSPSFVLDARHATW